MTDFTKVKANLEKRGYAVSCFATAAEAAAYLDGKLDGKPIVIGGGGCRGGSGGGEGVPPRRCAGECSNVKTDSGRWGLQQKGLV